MDARLDEVDPRAVSDAAPRLRFFSRGDEDLARFWEFVSRHGASVRRLRRDSISLEDAVLTVMDGTRRGIGGQGGNRGGAGRGGEAGR
jgi:hypothetical protein